MEAKQKVEVSGALTLKCLCNWIVGETTKIAEHSQASGSVSLRWVAPGLCIFNKHHR